MRERLLHGDGKAVSPACSTLLEQEYVTALEAAHGASGSKRFRGEVVCPECGGARLRPEARACRFGGRRFTRSRRCRVSQARGVVRRARSAADSDQPIARPIWQEIDQPARIPGQGRRRLPDARSAGRHAQRRRIAARAAGHRHRLGPGRRVLRARRAVDRPAPARQRAADRRPAATCSSRATPCWWSSTTKR